jgi:hypothetical protein
MDFVRNGDLASKATDLAMAANSDGAYWGGTFVDATFIREASYQLEVDLIAAKLGDPRGARVAEDVDLLLGTLSQITESGTAEWAQPFMCGLAAEALIQYYEDGHQNDARIPVALKKLADWLWTNAWTKDASGNGLFYNSYRNKIGLANIDGDMQSLNLLIVPMWGWLYQYTGDQQYLMQGDLIWSFGVLQRPGDGIAFAGKNFSQQYRWSFDYVRWRGGK